ncbi:MAG: sugar nucleotide-binding protein [Actinobacteria bacterium]|nr:sugar nucleotide-binding protein [Actinomycetota bacterium]
MCGIVGIYREDTEAPRDLPEALGHRMLGRLSHRGPDGDGEARVGDAWLGHRRLSIVDLEGGGQPLRNRDGSWWLVGNGEVYNHYRVRPRMRVLGADFLTASDNEVGLHLIDRLGPDSFMWRWLRDAAGVAETELEWFRENPCPPDVVGVNHYLSSERFIDERLDRYPVDAHGGNGRDAYADVLASRVLLEGAAGPAELLREAWERYGLPLAVTEVQNGCTREEQLRWLQEVWDGAEALRASGADVRAVTLWSFLGVCGWDKLVTSAEWTYEPGVYDVRGPRPRATAIATMARELEARGTWDHPVLGAPGWWRRPERLWYPPVSRGYGSASGTRRKQRPLLVTGARGTLGRAVARACEARGLACRLLTRQQMDIAERDSVAAALDALQPWAIVNAAGFVRVDEAETHDDVCRRENAHGPATLAEAAAARAIPLVTFSSDLVFDGSKGAPYVESDPASPLNVYGETKAEGERLALALNGQTLVVRTSAFFGPLDEWNFVTVALRALAAGEQFRAADDAVVSPTYVPHLVDAVLDLLVDAECGTWHLANDGATTWADLAEAAAALTGIPTATLERVPTEALGLAARRPLASALASERGQLLPTLEHALERYVAECALLPRTRALAA